MPGEMERSFLEYAMGHRAAGPADVRDGLKPVHRRILGADDPRAHDVPA